MAAAQNFRPACSAVFDCFCPSDGWTFYEICPQVKEQAFIRFRAALCGCPSKTEIRGDLFELRCHLLCGSTSKPALRVVGTDFLSRFCEDSRLVPPEIGTSLSFTCGQISVECSTRQPYRTFSGRTCGWKCYTQQPLSAQNQPQSLHGGMFESYPIKKTLIL